VLIEKDKLVGVGGKLGNSTFEARGKLIVDASGLADAVRTKLPDAFGIENKPVPPEKCLYVCLELRDQIPAGFPTGSNSYLFTKLSGTRVMGMAPSWESDNPSVLRMPGGCTKPGGRNILVTPEK